MTQLPEPESEGSPVKGRPVKMDEYEAECFYCGYVSIVPKHSTLANHLCEACGETLEAPTEEPVVGEEEEERSDETNAAIPDYVFDEKTGMRLERRESLGFKKAGLDEFAPEGDPMEESLSSVKPVEVPRNAPPPLLEDPPPYQYPVDKTKRNLTIASGAVLLLSVGLMIYFSGDSPQEKEMKLQTPIAEPLLALAPTDSADAEEAKSVAMNFLQASGAKAILPFLRKTPDIEEKVIRYYSPRRGELPLTINQETKMESKGIANRAGIRFHCLTVELGPNNLRDLWLEKNGDYKVDWESFVGWSEKTWKDFKLADPLPDETILLRARVNFADHYNFPFEDQEEYQSLTLVSPDGDFSFTGYARRKETATMLRELEAILDVTGKSRHEATLRVRYPENAAHRFAVEIVEYLKNHWVL